LVEALLQRIQDRAVEGVRLSGLDAELGMSARQVRRLLAEHFGVSPVAVASTQRLLLAKQLLQETAMPLGEVALAAGFRSLRNFNASFQEHYAFTPGQCREAQPPPSGSGLKLKLSYPAPLAWGALLDYFRSRLVPGVESIHGEEYRRTVQLRGVVGWLRVWPNADKPQLIAELSPALWSQVGAVRNRLRRMFDLDANPAAVAEVLGTDPLTAPVLEHYPGLRIGGAWESFELAVRAVLGQQVTVAAADENHTDISRLDVDLGEVGR
jgi:AraC family transcriptional regulator of adaptative response / DNA-3-methyladenine glycosylase II